MNRQSKARPRQDAWPCTTQVEGHWRAVLKRCGEKHPIQQLDSSFGWFKVVGKVRVSASSNLTLGWPRTI
jgi:hypothetical protein